MKYTSSFACSQTVDKIKITLISTERSEWRNLMRSLRAFVSLS